MNSRVIPIFIKFSQCTLTLINDLTMPERSYFQIINEIVLNLRFAVIIRFCHFLASSNGLVARNEKQTLSSYDNN